MDRRQALKQIGALTGSLAAGVALSAVGAGCRVHPGSDYQPRAFSDAAFQRLNRLVDIIIPATDTPGASAVGVPGFIDELLADVESSENAGRFLDAFDELPEGHPDDLPAIERLDKRAYSEDGTGAASGDETTDGTDDETVDETTDGSDDETADHIWTWRRLKEWTLVGYYTSEEGACHELHIMPYGPFRGDTPVTKTWA